MELLPVLLMEDVVHTGVDQLLLLVLQVLSHIIWYKYNAAVSIHHKQKAIQGLGTIEGGKWRVECDLLMHIITLYTPYLLLLINLLTSCENCQQSTDPAYWRVSGVNVPRLTCSSNGPRWSLSMTPWPVEDTSAFWTSSLLHELFPEDRQVISYYWQWELSFNIHMYIIAFWKDSLYLAKYFHGEIQHKKWNCDQKLTDILYSDFEYRGENHWAADRW